MLTLSAILVFSYLLGSIPASLIAGRLHGVDLREHGSGNAGATNALRVLGKRTGLLVFASDFLKGFVASGVVSQFRFGDLPPLTPDAEAWIVVGAGVAAMLGHVYTLTGRLLFGSWKGGKGVATGGGMLLAMIPVAVVVGLAVFITTVWATRYVSLGSILTTLSLPITLLVQRAFGAEIPTPYLLLALALPAFIIYTHRTNVQRLLRGTESKIGQRAASQEPA